MNSSRRRDKFVLVGAGVAALVAVAWWLHVDGVLSRVFSLSANTPAVDAPTRMPARSDVAAPIVATQAPAVPIAPPASTPARTPDPIPATPPVVAETPPEASMPSAESAPAATADEHAASKESSEEDAPPSDARTPHGETVDLFAERIAKLEQYQGTDRNEASDAHDLEQFRSHAEDEAVSGVAQELRNHLGEWLAAFPQERAARLVLVSVECRTGVCQVLVGEETTDVSATARNLFETSFLTLANQAWWKQLGLSLQGISMHAAGASAGKPDHALWTIYLNRAEPS